MTVPPIDPIQPPSGHETNASYFPPAPAQHVSINAFALIGLITSITGTGCGVISLILSIIGLNQINKAPNRYNGKGLAVAGIVISFGTIIYLVIFINSLKHTGF